MRRFAIVLAVMGALALTAGQAQARHPRSYHGGPHRSHYHRPSWHYGPRGAYPPPVVRHHYYYGPRYVVPVPVYPQPYYYPPSSGFYYRGSGISIGIGF